MAKNPYFDFGDEEDAIEVSSVSSNDEGIPLFPQDVVSPIPTRPKISEKPVKSEGTISIPITIPLPDPVRPEETAPKPLRPPLAKPSIPEPVEAPVPKPLVIPEPNNDQLDYPQRDLDLDDTSDTAFDSSLENAKRKRTPVYEEEEEYEDAVEVRVTPESKDSKAKKIKKNGRNKFAEKRESNSGKFNMYDGGRWKVLTLRITVWFVLGIFILAGAKSILLPNKVNVDLLSKTISTQIGFNGFPVLAGEDFTRSFLKAYLTLSKSGEPLREKILASYLPGGNLQSWAQATDPIAPQIVVDGPFLMGAPELAGADTTRAVYTFEVQVASSSRQEPTPVFLRVPVYNENGVLAITAPPAFFANPGVTVGDGHISYPVSAKDSQDLRNPLDKFLVAWANSDSTTINQYAVGTSSAAVKTGMNGTVSFISESNLAVELASAKDATAPRRADVDVKWSANGNSWTQGYQLTVIHGADGKWYIQDITAGDFWAIPTR